MTFLLFYTIICIVILSVFETLKQDHFIPIVRKVAINFAVLTVILGAACFIIYLVGL